MRRKYEIELLERFLEEEVERHWAFHFRQGGLLDTREMLKKLNGRWEIQGDRLCFALIDEEMVCYEVWLSGTRARLRTGARGLDGTIENYEGNW